MTHHAKVQRYPVAEHHGHLVHREVDKSQKHVQAYVDRLQTGVINKGDVVHDFPQPSGSTVRVVVMANLPVGALPNTAATTSGAAQALRGT